MQLATETDDNFRQIRSVFYTLFGSDPLPPPPHFFQRSPATITHRNTKARARASMHRDTHVRAHTPAPGPVLTSARAEQWLGQTKRNSKPRQRCQKQSTIALERHQQVDMRRCQTSIKRSMLNLCVQNPCVARLCQRFFFFFGAKCKSMCKTKRKQKQITFSGGFVPSN